MVHATWPPMVGAGRVNEVHHPPTSASATEREALSAQIAGSAEYGRVVEYLSYARDLGLDTSQPEVIRRALHAGRAAHARDERQRERAHEALRLAAYNGSHPSVVYYMRLGDLIKVGTTRSIWRRAQSVNPQGVLAVEPGGPDREHDRHMQFAELHRHGEWFEFRPPLTDHVVQMREDFQARVRMSVEAWLAAQIAAGAGETRSRVLQDEVAPTLGTGDCLLRTGEAALAAGVPKQSITHWARTGRLAVARTSQSGAKLFRISDVIAAKSADMREAAARP